MFTIKISPNKKSRNFQVILKKKFKKKGKITHGTNERGKSAETQNRKLKLLCKVV